MARKDHHWITKSGNRYIVKSKVYIQGKRKSPERSFKSQKAAVAYYNSLFLGNKPPTTILPTTEQDTGNPAPTIPEIKIGKRSLLVRDIVTQYVKDNTLITESTREAYSNSVIWLNKYPIGRPIGGRVATEIRPPDIAAWAAAELAGGAAPRTVRAHWGALSAAWRAALARGEPLATLAAPRLRVADTALREAYISREKQALITAIAKETGYIEHLAWLLGQQLALRIGEVAGVNWEDFNLEQSEVYPHGKLTLSKQIGLKKAERRPTKTKDIRHLALTEPIRAALDNVPGNHTGPLFGKSKSTIMLRIRKLFQAAGLSSVNTHRMRHTAATSLLASGASIGAVQAITGHKSLSMLSRYSHAAEEIQAGAGAGLVAWLAG